jgi:hypothetical protein
VIVKKDVSPKVQAGHDRQASKVQSAPNAPMTITSPRLWIESVIAEAPFFPPFPLVPVGFPFELDEGDPGTNVALGLAMHDSATDDALCVRAPEFTLAFPPKSHAVDLRFWLS